jgi:hypothetical protein
MAKGGRAFVKNRRPTNNVNTTKRGVYYIGIDSLDVQKNPELQRNWFGPGQDLITDPNPFIERVRNHRALKHPKAVKSHHLIFSLRKVDYDAYKRSGRDYKEMVRSILGDYEKKHGVKLDWIAHIHEGEKSAEHPHCHVVVKAISDNLGDRGFQRIKFMAEDMKEMRASMELELDRFAKYRLLERENMNDISEQFGKSFSDVMESIAYDAERKKREGENEREYTKKKKKDRGR